MHDMAFLNVSSVSREGSSLVLALLLVGTFSTSGMAASKPGNTVTAHRSSLVHPSGDGAEEDDDDGADDPPEVPNRHVRTLEELRQGYEFQAADGLPLQAFKAPTLPDLEPYTVRALEAKIDRSTKGSVEVNSIFSESAFKLLLSTASKGFTEFGRRQNGSLRAIFVAGGYITVPDMARVLPPDVFEQTSPGVYLAHLPIVIRHGATLHIGPEVKQLRLSQDRGAIIANEGKLFVTKSAIVGWNEAGKRPAWFEDKHQFRPFMVSWGGSQTYISESRIASLGYASTKAYGLSITQYGSAMIERDVWPRPTGWLLNSEIEDLWYGFYSYEADDFVMRGNTLKNNIKYGFDPHDRSRRLIIAENEVFGTREKHGIIISREVKDSWVINNRSHDNTLTGIMLDRQCSNNVVANNVTFKNGADGIAISESSKNLVWNNLATGNQHHGVRVRNSTDVRIQDNFLIANGLTGVYGNARSLAELPRDLRIDPYTQTMSMVVVGGQMSGNGTGPIGLDDPTRAAFYNIDLRTGQRQLGYRFGGMFVAFQLEVLDTLINQKRVAIIQRRSATAIAASPLPSYSRIPVK